jgi:hypothetical protein
MFRPILLNTVHCGIVEQPCPAGTALVVAKPFDRQSIGQLTRFNDRRHLNLAAFRARKRLIYRCFFWTR